MIRLKSLTSFEAISDSQLADHLKVSKYDSFQLTDAVRPAMDLRSSHARGTDTTFILTKNQKQKFPL